MYTLQPGRLKLQIVYTLQPGRLKVRIVYTLQPGRLKVQIVYTLQPGCLKVQILSHPFSTPPLILMFVQDGEYISTYLKIYIYCSFL